MKKTQQSYCQIHDFGFGFNAQKSAINYVKRYSRQRVREREMMPLELQWQEIILETLFPPSQRLEMKFEEK